MHLDGACRALLPRSGDFLLDPVAVTAIVVLVLNDRWWKARWPGVATGKISDAAGMVVLPLLLVALTELARRSPSRSTRPFAAAAGVTATGFALVKAFDRVGRAYGAGLGQLRWALTAPFRLVLDRPSGTPVDVRVAHDPTDIAVIGFALVAVWIGGRHRRSTEAADSPRATPPGSRR